jgi:hypothetical protein
MSCVYMQSQDTSQGQGRAGRTSSRDPRTGRAADTCVLGMPIGVAALPTTAPPVRSSSQSHQAAADGRAASSHLLPYRILPLPASMQAKSRFPAQLSGQPQAASAPRVELPRAATPGAAGVRVYSLGASRDPRAGHAGAAASAGSGSAPRMAPGQSRQLPAPLQLHRNQRHAPDLSSSSGRAPTLHNLHSSPTTAMRHLPTSAQETVGPISSEAPLDMQQQQRRVPWQKMPDVPGAATAAPGSGAAGQLPSRAAHGAPPPAPSLIHHGRPASQALEDPVLARAAHLPDLPSRLLQQGPDQRSRTVASMQQSGSAAPAQSLEARYPRIHPLPAPALDVRYPKINFNVCQPPLPPAPVPYTGFGPPPLQHDPAYLGGAVDLGQGQALGLDASSAGHCDASHAAGQAHFAEPMLVDLQPALWIPTSQALGTAASRQYGNAAGLTHTAPALMHRPDHEAAAQAGCLDAAALTHSQLQEAGQGIGQPASIEGQHSTAAELEAGERGLAAHNPMHSF